MNAVPPFMPSDIFFTIAVMAETFQSPSAPYPYPCAIRRCDARPGSCSMP